MADLTQLGDGQSTVAGQSSLKGGEGDLRLSGEIQNGESELGAKAVDSLPEVGVRVGCHTETISYPNGYRQA